MEGSAARLLTVLLAFVLGACEAPVVGVDSAPTGASVLLDGRPAGVTPLSFTSPYYGTLELSIEKPIALGTELRPAVREVSVEPVATGWVFPLDLPIEIVAWLFEERRQDVMVPLEPLPPAALTVERATALVAATRAAALAR